MVLVGKYVGLCVYVVGVQCSDTSMQFLLGGPRRYRMVMYLSLIHI